MRKKNKINIQATVPKAKKSMNVGFVNLSSYVLPEIKEETGKFNYVKFGENNDYFQILIDRYV